jgi:Asp-tRNA(Asn)/Glu-tRNA(Gln) amidotransferase A subunit family amidase
MRIRICPEISMMFDLSVLELSAAIKGKKLGVAEVVNAYIERIEKNRG